MYTYTYVSIFLIYVNTVAVPFASLITYCYLFCIVQCQKKEYTCKCNIVASGTLR